MNHRMTLLVVAGTLAAGGAAVAGTESHVDVTFTTPTVVSGQRIPAGDYRLAWAGGPNDVRVTFEKGSKVVAQVNAKLEQLKEPSPEEELISRTMKDGVRSLEEVRLRKQKTALVFPVS
jgi:hypothetical protein